MRACLAKGMPHCILNSKSWTRKTMPVHKMAILADVAPYSRQYNTYRQRVGAQAHSTNDTELEIEYEKILNRVKQTRESVIRMQDRHFTNPVEEIAGTVDQEETSFSTFCHL
jgi:hypothetical protein